MVHCGRRLRDLIKKSGFQFKDFAAQIDAPPTTLSNWFRWDLIPINNIVRCCEVLKIDVWEFFYDGDKNIDYVTLGLEDIDREILEELRKMPKDKKKMFWLGFRSLIESMR